MNSATLSPDRETLSPVDAGAKIVVDRENGAHRAIVRVEPQGEFTLGVRSRRTLRCSRHTLRGDLAQIAIRRPGSH